jgi:hypothetical protein
MTDRKRTPDILSEVLGESPAPAAPALEVDMPERTLPATPKPATRRAAVQPATTIQTPAAAGWTYLIVSFQNHNGWRPRYVNGKKLADWTAQPEMHDYANQLGHEGWELAGASAGENLYGHADHFQLYFKRSA